MAEASSISLNDNESLHDAQLEVRHLKDTLFVLRGKLEDQEFNRDAAVQQAVQHSADEILQLKNTATSLRDELESLRFEKDAAVQQAVQRSAD
ncbi:MAG: hypothetical protein CMF67_13095, partial [Magnetovibrio sp.]|nr:hypothetical protein [Magnetovibrio sp.]